MTAGPATRARLSFIPHVAHIAKSKRPHVGQHGGHGGHGAWEEAGEGGRAAARASSHGGQSHRRPSATRRQGQPRAVGAMTNLVLPQRAEWPRRPPHDAPRRRARTARDCASGSRMARQGRATGGDEGMATADADAGRAAGRAAGRWRPAQCSNATRAQQAGLSADGDPMLTHADGADRVQRRPRRALAACGAARLALL